MREGAASNILTTQPHALTCGGVGRYTMRVILILKREEGHDKVKGEWRGAWHDKGGGGRGMARYGGRWEGHGTIREEGKSNRKIVNSTANNIS